ncbi:hypothetical protein A21D_03986 [Virgibacillus dokdonensis]|uniref:Uncharacterized protein n=1 Tax=Virgibacillus dokdonensis TaxID=302167 RepID=A0A2K9J9V2_9BACI|nr:hypothetical protein A21D_03986 [Virgibacillus dokdonensis]
MLKGRIIQWIGCFVALFSLFLNLITENKTLSFSFASLGCVILIIGLIVSRKQKKNS